MKAAVLLACLFLLCAEVCPAQVENWGSTIDGSKSTLTRMSPDFNGLIVFVPLLGRVSLMAPLSQSAGTVQVSFRWTKGSKPQQLSLPFSIERTNGPEGTPFLRSMGDDVLQVSQAFIDASTFVVVEYENVALEFNAIGFTKAMREVIWAAR